jgi:antitoxin (DNA-binding transcriptional repressor) of toxin-antitoxin stability system
MTTFTIHEAKTHLSRLINAVLSGEEVVLARGKNPVARIVPLHPPAPKRRTPGRFADPAVKGLLDHGFWDPLPEDHLGLAVRDEYTP